MSENKIFRPLCLQLGLVLAVILYLVFGGILFNLLESTGETDQAWNIIPSIMFCFTIITTIGYGNVAPVTAMGRCFCIIYGFIGIPITMLIIANLGKFLMASGQAFTKKISRKSANDEDMTTSLTGIVLLTAFALYITIGALILPLYEREMDFFSAIYFNFVTLTTVGLGDFVPSSGNAFLLFSLIYITIGLALTTIAIEVASDYLKKLHYFGRKFTNVGNVTIWVGGQSVSLKGLAKVVGTEVGATAEQTEHMLINLDGLVDRAIAAELEAKVPMQQINPRVIEDLVRNNIDGCNAIGVPTLNIVFQTFERRSGICTANSDDSFATRVPLPGNLLLDCEDVSLKFDEVSESHSTAETVHQEVPDLPVTPVDSVAPLSIDAFSNEEPRSRRLRRDSLPLEPVRVWVPVRETGRRNFRHDAKKTMERYQQEWARMPGRRASVQQQPVAAGRRKTSLPAQSLSLSPTQVAHLNWVADKRRRDSEDSTMLE